MTQNFLCRCKKLVCVSCDEEIDVATLYVEIRNWRETIVAREKTITELQAKITQQAEIIRAYGKALKQIDAPLPVNQFDRLVFAVNAKNIAKDVLKQFPLSAESGGGG